MQRGHFNGFSPDALAFLDALKANNNREWFAEYKSAYDLLIKRPADDFCQEMAAMLQQLTGRKHKSKLFRVHRDVRFSKDKTPYNTHIHIAFTPQSSLKSPPMWFFGLDTQSLALGCGVFAFDKQELEKFRQTVVSEGGDAIAQCLHGLRNNGLRLSEPELKRVPGGHQQDHPREALLRHKGLSVWSDIPDRAMATRADILQQCHTRFNVLRPVYDLILGLE